MRVRTIGLALAAASALSLGTVGQASAGTVPPGVGMKSDGGEIFVHFIDSEAALRSELWYFGGADQLASQTPDLSPTKAVYLFDNFSNAGDHSSTAPGAAGTAPLGSPTGDISHYAGGPLATGSSLSFGLFVQGLYNDGTGAWFYADPGTNIDGRWHVSINETSPYQYTVGFEDLCKDPANQAAAVCNDTKYAADFDLNDHIFGVTQNPEPVSMALLGTGLLGLVGVSRRKRRERLEDAV